MGLACQRECLAAVGLTPGVVNCIQGARAPSTRALCDAKWKLFHKWCSAQSPGWCLPKHLLVRSFGSCRAGLAKASPTLLLWSIWLPSLLVTPDTLASRSLSIPWSPFLKGVRRATATDKPLFPLWDLAVVLEGLCKPPFEPLRSADIRTLSLMTVLLVALTTTKRVRDIHALSVDQECMRFSDDRWTVWLKPNLKFVTKNLRVPEVTAKLVAFHPPPFLTDRVRGFIVSAQLEHSGSMCRGLGVLGLQVNFVSYKAGGRHSAVGRESLSCWVVEAVGTAYMSSGAPVPEALRAHSTRGVSTSWPQAKGASSQEIWESANWSSPSTFVAFYHLDVCDIGSTGCVGCC